MIKKIKSILCVVIILCICAVVINVSANTSDKTAPILNSITFNNTSVNPGENLYFNIDANDDVSGIDYVMVELKRIDNKAVTPVSNEYTYYSDNMYIKVPYNAMPGEYYISTIMIADKAGNVRHYVNNLYNISNMSFGYEVEWRDYSQIININSVGQDIMPPTITDVNILNTNLTQNDAIVLTINVFDDASGIENINFCLYSETIELECFQGGTYDSTTGIYTMNLPVSYLKSNGIYKNLSVTVYDYAGNRADVGSDGNGTDLERKLSNMTINVSGKNVDNEKPLYKSIKIDKTKVTSPSIVKMEIDVQDSSGMDNVAHVTFIGENDPSNILSSEIYYNYETLKYEGYIDINQYIAADNYKLTSFYLCDNADNCTNYGIPDGGKYDGLIDKKLEENIYIEVVAGETYDVVTSTTDNDILEKIKNTSNDAKISIDSTNNPIISKEIFESIKGTKRTIYIETNGIQWIFNGEDIDNPKDINVAVNIQMIYDYADENLNNILEKAIIFDFANNGKLPGKALVRIKASYAFRNYVGTEDLYVYYYDPDTKMFNRVTDGISGDEYYYEFYITHNSIYTLTNKKIADKYVTDDTSDLELNLETSKSKDKRKKDYNNYLIYYICAGILTILLVVVIVVLRKKKSKKTNKKKEINKNVDTDNNEKNANDESNN